jgi:guanylate kinase
MKSGRDVVVKVDVQGAASIRRAVPEAVLVFIRPPSLKELEQRLRNRDSETATELNVRLGKAAWEYEQMPLFDYVLTNQQDGIDEVVRAIQAIVVAEKSRVNPRRVSL